MCRKLALFLLCILYLLLIVASGCAPTLSQQKQQFKKMDSAGLIRKINQVDDELKVNIISILQERREITVLENLLFHEDKWVRKWAIDALGNSKSTQAVPNIINFILDQNNEWVRGHAGIALAKIGDKRTYDILINLLNDKHPAVRQFTAKALEIYGDKKAIAPLTNLLSDSNDSVRISAIKALANLGGRSIKRYLFKVIADDPDSYVSNIATKELEKLGLFYGSQLKEEKETAYRIEPVTEKPAKMEKIVTSPKIGNYYAVVIGIANYQDDRIPKLRYTTVDAEEIYNILTDPQYGNFPENQVKLLIDEHATYNNIKSAIGTWLKRHTQKNDTVIIFFAGHGAPEDEKTYWVTYNANIDDLYGTALSNDEIADMLDRVEAKKMIAFLDSCYSAATINRTDKKRSIMIVNDPFLKFKGKGRVIITSSDGKEQSVEIDKFGHGIFTYYLLKALKGDADKNRDGYIELDEVWDYVKYRVPDTARQYGSTQTPMLDGSYSAGIVLSKHPERLKKLSLEAEREKREKELASRIARLTALYSNGDITSSQFDKAVKILKSEKKNKLLDDFLADKISLTTFKTVFK
jgi:uncharacterized caspase-like protein